MDMNMNMNQPVDQNKPRAFSAPPGVLEGVWSLDARLDSPDIMRDCLRERYWEKPNRAEYFKAARRLTDDLKRRGCPEPKALELISGHLIVKLKLDRKEHLRNIEKAIHWVYEKQEHGLTCSDNGCLAVEGLCHRLTKRCVFFERAQEIAKGRLANVQSGLPNELENELSNLHPTTALFARWTYLTLLSIETERGLRPGDEKQPIFVGFRTLVDRVRVQQGSAAYTRYAAVDSIRLLEDIGAIKKVVQGSSGTMRRRANGYIRQLPPSGTPAVTESPTSPISPIINSESGIGPQLVSETVNP